jgi:hypothetical protein
MIQKMQGLGGGWSVNLYQLDFGRWLFYEGLGLGDMNRI